MNKTHEPWPYCLPIFRRSHSASSPDGRWMAEIAQASEVAMSCRTSGDLIVSNGLKLDWCNPSFIWSDDSRYLAVPRYVIRFGIIRRQRMVVIDVRERVAYASPKGAFYFQPESFIGGTLVAVREPFHAAERITWRIPEALSAFAPIKSDSKVRMTYAKWQRYSAFNQPSPAPTGLPSVLPALAPAGRAPFSPDQGPP